jgi:hypothetical protein
MVADADAVRLVDDVEESGDNCALELRSRPA